MDMTGLVAELKKNGFAGPSRTLEYVYSNTCQDAQYGGGADIQEAIKIMRPFAADPKYAKMTVAEIFSEAAIKN